MKILKIAVVAIGAIFVVLIIVSLFLPKAIHVQRKAVVHAQPAVVFGVVSNLHSWSAWDPWSSEDSTMKVDFEGPQTGVGSIRKWNSEKMGKGSMAIVGAVPNQSVDYVVDFGQKEKSKASMTMNPTADGTEVTWGMDLDFGGFPLFRYMGLMADKFIGTDFEKGLKQLDKYVGALPAPAPAAAPTTVATGDSSGVKAE
jgi:hypothetical protein